MLFSCVPASSVEKLNVKAYVGRLVVKQMWLYTCNRKWKRKSNCYRQWLKIADNCRRFLCWSPESLLQIIRKESKNIPAFWLLASFSYATPLAWQFRIIRWISIKLLKLFSMLNWSGAGDEPKQKDYGVSGNPPCWINKPSVFSRV